MISSGGNEFKVTKRIKIEAFIFVKSNVSQAGLGDKKYLCTAQCVSMAMQLIKSFGNPEFTDWMYKCESSTHSPTESRYTVVVHRSFVLQVSKWTN